MSDYCTTPCSDAAGTCSEHCPHLRREHPLDAARGIGYGLALSLGLYGIIATIVIAVWALWP